MEEATRQVQAACRQCRKDIKTETYRCMLSMENFHPSCHKLHKVHNFANELVPCTSKVEIITAKWGTLYENGKTTNTVNEKSLASGTTMDGKINRIYKLLVEMKEEVISRDYIKQVIAEVVNDEMDKIREEIQQWKTTKLEPLIGQAVRREVQSIKDVAATLIVSEETSKSTVKL